MATTQASRAAVQKFAGLKQKPKNASQSQSETQQVIEAVSLSAAREIIEAAMGYMLYHRKFFPVDRFDHKPIDVKKGGTVPSLPVLRSDEHGSNLNPYLDGIMDAIVRRYLKTVSFVLVKNAGDINSALESVTLFVSYTAGSNVVVSDQAKLGKAEMTSHQVRSKLIATMKTFSTGYQSIIAMGGQAPEDISFDIVVTYNENTPDDYAPPALRTGEQEPVVMYTPGTDKPPKAASTPSAETNHHAFELGFHSAIPFYRKNVSEEELVSAWTINASESKDSMILFGRLTTIGLIPFVEGSGMFDSLDTQGIEVWSPPGRERKDLSSKNEGWSRLNPTQHGLSQLSLKDVLAIPAVADDSMATMAIPAIDSENDMLDEDAEGEDDVSEAHDILAARDLTPPLPQRLANVDEGSSSSSSDEDTPEEEEFNPKRGLSGTYLLNSGFCSQILPNRSSRAGSIRSQSQAPQLTTGANRKPAPKRKSKARSREKITKSKRALPTVVTKKKRKVTSRVSASTDRIRPTADDNETIDCLCGIHHADGEMLLCDACNAWKHAACVGVLDMRQIEEESFNCQSCRILGQADHLPSQEAMSIINGRLKALSLRRKALVLVRERGGLASEFQLQKLLEYNVKDAASILGDLIKEGFLGAANKKGYRNYVDSSDQELLLNEYFIQNGQHEDLVMRPPSPSIADEDEMDVDEEIPLPIGRSNGQGSPLPSGRATASSSPFIQHLPAYGILSGSESQFQGTDNRASEEDLHDDIGDFEDSATIRAHSPQSLIASSLLSGRFSRLMSQDNDVDDEDSIRVNKTLDVDPIIQQAILSGNFKRRTVEQDGQEEIRPILKRSKTSRLPQPIRRLIPQ